VTVSGTLQVMDDQKYLQEIMDYQPGAMIAFDSGFNVVWMNLSAEEQAPSVKVGANLYDAFAPFANEEKIDRLLLKGEKVMFSPGEGLPLLEWLVHHKALSNGDEVVMAWDPDITDELVQRRATFSMAAAHELKSPLTALIGFTEILEMDRGNLTPLQQEAIEMITANALYLQTLVNDILDLTSNSFGELKLDLAPTDIAVVIADVTESLAVRIEERNQHLEVEVEAGLPQIEADPTRIRQVVQNLLQNATVHTGSGTTIGVRAFIRDDGIVITIEDDGPGLPFERPQEAFASFRHASAVSAGQMTGSGIGLTVTKRVTELHRGKISVESIEGQGTRFEVWLPLDRANTFTRTPPGPA
jgi:signal transduction histidine kinase